MNADKPDAKTIFAEALRLSASAERGGYLDQVCVGNQALRQEVESLLAAYNNAGTFLDQTGSLAVGDPVMEATGTMIGRYKLLEKIGEGGFGMVYMAEQTEPVQRKVALKIIKPGMDTREVVARFEAERQALALMDHPNIAKVLDAGATAAGRPYFVMELVRGIPITDYCDQKSLPTAERLRLFILVCHAVQHAHQKGIIHRDLKPSNVMVTLHDGVPLPKVIDFGVAKALGHRLTEKTLFTGFAQMLGTPAYMSPEQAGLSGLDIDTRSDIYSLGVLLYELLTGTTPFEKETLVNAALDEIRRIIRETEPPKPSTRLHTMGARLVEVAKHRKTEPGALGRLVRGDLDWVVMKCLEKDRQRRYEAANDLALDITKHLVQQPVSAGPPGVGYQFRKFVCRNKVAVTAATAVVGALGLGLVVSTWQWRRAETAKRGEAWQRQLAERSAMEKRAQLVQLNVANGVRALENEDWYGALLWFTEALRHDAPGTRSERMHRYRIGALLQYTPRLTQVWAHDGPVRSAVFSPDGQQVLTASADGTARLWDVRSGRPGFVLRCSTNISDAMFSGDGRRVLTFSRNATGPVSVWECATGQLVGPPLEHGYRTTHALLGPDGRRVFTLGDPNELTLLSEHPPRLSANHGEIRIWDTATGRQVRQPFAGSEWIRELALAADGQWLAAALRSSVVVWDLRHPRALYFSSVTKAQPLVIPGLSSETGARQAELETLLPGLLSRSGLTDAPGPHATCLAFSPGSDQLLVGCADGSGWIRSLPDGTSILLRAPKLHRNGTRSVEARYAAFTPDGYRAVLADDSGTLRFWDAHTGEMEGQLEQKTSDRLALSPDGRFAFLAGQLWDVNLTKSVAPVPLHAGFTCAAFSPDGARILTGSSDGTARLWHLAGCVPPEPPLRHDPALVRARRRLALTPSQPVVAPDLGSELWEESPEIIEAVISPDGQRVLTVGLGGSARIWDTATGAPVTPLVVMSGPLECGGFSPDGAHFVTCGGVGGSVGRARVWDSVTGEAVTPVITGPDLLKEPKLSPEARWLFTSTTHGAQVWDTRTGQPAQWPLIAGRQMSSIALSADGRRLAISGCRQATSTTAAKSPACETRIYEPATWRPVAPPLDETNEIREMHFSPDGRWLLTLGTRPIATWSTVPVVVNSARLWDANTGQAVSAPFQGWVSEVVFTGDNHYLFVLRVEAKPMIWDLAARCEVDPDRWRGLRFARSLLSNDGEKVAVPGDSEIRVYDALTAEPLAVPLCDRRGYRFAKVAFGPRDELLVIAAEDRAQLWPLPKATRAVAELAGVAELLAGRRVDAYGHLTELPAADARRSWEILQAKYPATFTATASQERTWREWTAEGAEKTQHWYAALFHLDQLVAAYPGDESLRLRRARVRNEAALEELRNTSGYP